MMKENRIVVNIGDTAKVKVSILDKQGKRYLLSNGDRLVFEVYEYYNKDPIIRKEINENVLFLSSDDTKLLKANYVYPYKVKLITKNGDVETFINDEIKGVN